MNGRYPIPLLAPANRHCYEENIRRSRFIAHLAHCPNTQAAHDFIAWIRHEYPDATHNCWAFVAGAPGNTAHVGFSDDGEPHGTAGRPMLTVLLHSTLGEIAAVVTRYFGGVKLGTGGLVRAYQGVVRAALETVPRTERIVPQRLEIVLEYSQITAVQRLIARYEGTIQQETYTADASLLLDIPCERVTAFETALVNLTGGNVLIQQQDTLEAE